MTKTSGDRHGQNRAPLRRVPARSALAPSHRPGAGGLRPQRRRPRTVSPRRSLRARSQRLASTASDGGRRGRTPPQAATATFEPFRTGRDQKRQQAAAPASMRMMRALMGSRVLNRFQPPCERGRPIAPAISTPVGPPPNTKIEQDRRCRDRFGFRLFKSQPDCAGGYA